MEVGLVRPIDIDLTMQQAYLDYAMSVIVARALPDARDGLKPVHRRILYAMFDMGLRPDTAYKKSARIVGEVLGKYHPHGDLAVYESMARMAQDFSMRCLLVEGQGNFGSMDGDPPAAMRYTEARLTAPAMQMLADIRKETVDFSANFDASLTEPDVLPSALPNLLVNGATGIAVGMSTNIPPHNLGEVVDALVYMLENWDRLDDVNIEHLMKFIQGPDFPTGGFIVQDTHEEGLNAAYGTGRGRVTVQARCHIEEITRGRNRIIITELPYMTNKSTLIEHIAHLARESSLEGITDLRDESDRHGLRIVVELSRTAEPEKVLQDLYKRTAMRSTFGIIMLALVDGEPRMLSLKQALRVYLDHRLVVIRRRTEYELAKARDRLHILEGLRVALRHLDAIIELIKKAPDADIARDRLMKRYRLSEIQAQAILDMQLRRLAALERKKIEQEYKGLQAQIKQLEALLSSPLKMRQVVATELHQVKEEYGDRRRTQITRLGADAKSILPVLTATDLLPEQVVWISATSDGLVSRTLGDKPPRISGMAAPRFLLQVNTRDTLFLVSDKGEAAGIPVQTIPEAQNPQDGAPAHKISALSESENLAALFTLPPKEERLPNWFVFTASQQGMLKKTAIEEFPGPTGHSFTLVKINEDDQLGWLRLTNGKAEILLASAAGMTIRFHEDQVRPMGLVAAGVAGIKLGDKDQVIGMEIIPRRGEILLLASDGKAKRVATNQFPQQGRYGRGVIAWKLPRTARLIGIAAGKPNTRVTLLLDKLAPKAMRLDEAPLRTRAASGKAVVELKTGYQLLGLSLPWAVPRPVAGEKATPEKELELPDEPESTRAAPEVEQLSFGMDAPPEKPRPKTTRSTRPKPRQTTKPKTQGSARKTRASKGEQASLITKPESPAKKTRPVKTGRSKSVRVSPTTKQTTSSRHTSPGTKTSTRASKPKSPSASPSQGKTSRVTTKKSTAKAASTTRKLMSTAKQAALPEKKPPSKTSSSKTTRSTSKTTLPAPKTGEITPARRKATKTENKQSSNIQQRKTTAKKPTAQKAAKPERKKPATKKTDQSASSKTGTPRPKVRIPTGWKPSTKKPTKTRRKS